MPISRQLIARYTAVLLVLCGIAWVGDRWGSPDGSHICVPSGLSDAMCAYVWTSLEVLPSGDIVLDQRWYGIWHENTRTGTLRRIISGRLPIWPLVSCTCISAAGLIGCGVYGRRLGRNNGGKWNGRRTTARPVT